MQLALLHFELLINLEGITATAPRLSWELSTLRPGANRLLAAGLNARQAGRLRGRFVELG